MTKTALLSFCFMVILFVCWYSRKSLLNISGHVHICSLLHIEICEIILTIGIKIPSNANNRAYGLIAHLVVST